MGEHANLERALEDLDLFKQSPSSFGSSDGASLHIHAEGIYFSRFPAGVARSEMRGALEDCSQDRWSRGRLSAGSLGQSLRSNWHRVAVWCHVPHAMHEFLLRSPCQGIGGHSAGVYRADELHPKQK